VQFWRDRNGAATLSDSRVINGDPSDGTSVNRYVYGADLPFDARGIRPVVSYYSVFNGGHEWPGSPGYYGQGVISRDINLNKEIISFFTTNTTAVETPETGDRQIPADYALDQNFPNPFNPTTTIDFRLPTTGYCRLAIFDLLGREVAVLVDEEKAAGSHTATWDASRLPSGIYLYTMKSGPFVMTKRMVLIK
jgi:hypothetical protein